MNWFKKNKFDYEFEMNRRIRLEREKARDAETRIGITESVAVKVLGRYGVEAVDEFYKLLEYHQRRQDES